MNDAIPWRKYERAEENLLRRRNKSIAEVEARQEKGEITPEEFLRIIEEIETDYQKSLENLDKAYAEERNRVLGGAQ